MMISSFCLRLTKMLTRLKSTNTDMTIDRIAISPEAYDEAKAGRPQCFETMIFNVVNGALKRAKDATQAEMMNMMKAIGGAGGLFGK